MKKRGIVGRLKQKKAQITVFILAAIFILIFAMIFIFVNTSKQKIPIVPVIEDIPVQFRPIRSYVEDCLTSLAKEAVKKIGAQGGYINPKEFGIITSAATPTESDGLLFSPDSNLNIPYWWYLKGPNDCHGNCLFSSQKPRLKRKSGSRSDNSIESQIDWYISDNLKTCLNDFQPFKEQGYTIESKEPEVTTIISESDVGVYLKYPLNIKIQNTTNKISDFYTSLPLNLLRIYELAQDITNKQIEFSFLERHTLNLITSFASLDKNSLPPITESTFNFGTGLTWTTEEVKMNIENILMNYIPALQVFGTLNYGREIFPGDTIKQSLYDQMILPMNLDNKYNDLGVRFDYLGWWPIYFNAGEGGIIQAESAIIPFINFGIQRYSTTYDISFPAVVTLTDPSALDGQGYTFMFALEGNLRNNRPIDESFQGLQGVYIFQPSLLCNQNQRNSGDITIKTVNANTKKPLEDVQIAYTCGEESCIIGSTDKSGILTAKYPICYNGIISFIKQDFFTPVRFFTTELDKEKSLPDIQLYPFIEKEIEIEKRIYSPRLKQLSINARNIDPKESIVISLKKIKQDIGEEEVMTAAEIFGNQTTPSKLRLVPGIYEVRIYAFLHDSVVIPEEKRKTGAGFFGKMFGAEEEYTIPEIRFNESFPSGGVILNEQTGFLTIDPKKLYKDNKIIFYIISPTIPKSIEDLSETSKIQEYSAKYRNMLEPIYVSNLDI